MNVLKKQKRWVVWNWEGAGDKRTKVPYSIMGTRASSTDPLTWTTYAKAKKTLPFFSGVGIIFTPDQLLLGIDIDHILSEDGKINHWAKADIEKLLAQTNSYTEISPSGTGLHILLALSAPLPLIANKHAPWEMYTSGRFFTFSENIYGEKKPLRTVSPEEALLILSITGYPWGKDKPSLQPTVVSSFSDEELKERMFASKNGPAIKSLYDGDVSMHGNDTSRADAALLSHLAFWSGKNPDQMERVWLFSPLGLREKSQSRKDYRDRSIASAIKNCTDVYTSPNLGIDFLWTKGVKGEKLYSKNTENVARVLRHHGDFSNMIRFDSFKNRVEVKEKGIWRHFIDSDAIYLQTRISILFSFLRTVGKEMTWDASIIVAKENAIDSGADFIRSLKWDGTARLDQWLTYTYGTPDDVYHRAVGSNWLKGLVKRVIEPGCKFDYVLVLEGEQGIKKSMSLNILGHISEKENWHVESTMSTDSKDFFMQFEGKAIIEFSEGETLTRTEVKKMKSIITTASDRYRPSYGRTTEDFPRHCVFAMTTNQEEYLKDDTGNRRWLPVKVVLSNANVEWLQENRDQLFAEAYHRVVVGKENVYELPREETLAQQSARKVGDPNEERIVEWYYSVMVSDEQRTDGITIQMVYNAALNGFGSMKKWEEMAIANILRGVLKLTKVRRMVHGIHANRWINEHEVPAQLIEQEKF